MKKIKPSRKGSKRQNNLRFSKQGSLSLARRRDRKSLSCGASVKTDARLCMSSTSKADTPSCAAARFALVIFFFKTASAAQVQEPRIRECSGSRCTPNQFSIVHLYLQINSNKMVMWGLFRTLTLANTSTPTFTLPAC